MHSSPVSHAGMNLSVISLTIEGGGRMLGSDLHVEATDLIIDAGGVLSLSEEGYKLADGNGQGVNGVINFGRGTGSGSGSSGGGHGGTGGKGSLSGADYVGLPYGNLYEPTDFGSSGGGVTGLKGKTRIWSQPSELILNKKIYHHQLKFCSETDGCKQSYLIAKYMYKWEKLV